MLLLVDILIHQYTHPHYGKGRREEGGEKEIM
jgi:hypothetical protein